MKRKIFFVAMTVICLSLLAYGTLAYFTGDVTAHNVITSSGIDIQLVEKTQTSNGKLEDFPKEGISGIMPGSDASKIVSVKNTGEAEAWVRVKVEVSITGADGKPLPTTIAKGTEQVQIITWQVGADWTLKDGWYYYTGSVPAQQTTSILFDTVHFAPEMDNQYKGCTANIIVTAQAVQTAHNGESALEALGWPGESLK